MGESGREKIGITGGEPLDAMIHVSPPSPVQDNPDLSLGVPMPGEPATGFQFQQGEQRTVGVDQGSLEISGPAFDPPGDLTAVVRDHALGSVGL